MVINADKIGSLVTVGEDPRITKIGKRLRGCRLDELPQLINIWKGEMTFVGTRPEVEKYVKRLNSDPGDIIVLLGGRTGRDGIGGATGSSKVHTEASIEVCGAEVQKGNAPTERKIQRMFRRPVLRECGNSPFAFQPVGEKQKFLA